MLHHGLSSAHTDEDLARALDGIKAVLRDVMAWGTGRQETTR